MDQPGTSHQDRLKQTSGASPNQQEAARALAEAIMAYEQGSKKSRVQGIYAYEFSLHDLGFDKALVCGQLRGFADGNIPALNDQAFLEALYKIIPEYYKKVEYYEPAKDQLETVRQAFITLQNTGAAYAPPAHLRQQQGGWNK